MRLRRSGDIVPFILSTLVGGGIVALTMCATGLTVLSHPLQLNRSSEMEAIWTIAKVLGPPLLVLLCAIAILAFPAFHRASEPTMTSSGADREAYGG